MSTINICEIEPYIICRSSFGIASGQLEEWSKDLPGFLSKIALPRHFPKFGIKSFGGMRVSEVLGILAIGQSLQLEAHFQGNNINNINWPEASPKVQFLLERNSPYYENSIDSIQPHIIYNIYLNERTYHGGIFVPVVPVLNIINPSDFFVQVVTSPKTINPLSGVPWFLERIGSETVINTDYYVDKYGNPKAPLHRLKEFMEHCVK